MILLLFLKTNSIHFSNNGMNKSVSHLPSKFLQFLLFMIFYSQVHFRKSVKMPSKQPKDYSIQLTEEMTATVAIQEKKIPNFLPISNHIFNISYLQANHPSLCHSLFYLLFTQHSILLLSHDLSLLSSLSNFLIETCHSLPIQVYLFSSSFILQYSFIFYSTEHQYLHDTSFHYFLHSSPTNLITCMEVSFQPPEEYLLFLLN